MILITPLCQHALLFCLVLNYEQRCFFWWLKQIQTWPFIYLKKITTVNFSCDNIVRRTKLPYQFVNNWERKWCARPLDVYYLLADWSLVAFRTCPWKLFIRWLFFFFFFYPNQNTCWMKSAPFANRIVYNTNAVGKQTQLIVWAELLGSLTHRKTFMVSESLKD